MDSSICGVELGCSLGVGESIASTSPVSLVARVSDIVPRSSSACSRTSSSVLFLAGEAGWATFFHAFPALWAPTPANIARTSEIAANGAHNGRFQRGVTSASIVARNP